MKILLVNPPTRLWRPPNCFPTGLGMIAQVLREDHDLEIMDLNILRPEGFASIAEAFLHCVNGDFDAVGITGLITNYSYV